MICDATSRRFAVACADCHEGECSGRLGFARDPEAAAIHIRQYAGPVDDAIALALFEVLEVMKRQCRYTSLEGVELLNDGLGPAGLAAARDAWRGHYWIPLRAIGAGGYRLHGQLAADGRVRIEIVDSFFDNWVDDCLYTENGRFSVRLELPARSQRFIRLLPADGRRVVALSLRQVE